MTRTFVFVFVALIQLNVFAQQSYYPPITQLSELKDEDLKSEIHEIIQKDHKAYGYNRARAFLFGKFYLVKTDSQSYGIKEVYCDRVYESEDFSKGEKPGVNVIPDSTIMNVEHTWPQSKFTKLYPKELQKSDLHHLFPTDSVMNSLRGNFIFGEVDSNERDVKCNTSRFGSGSAGHDPIFEPPDNHKGHVARALFYFSVRYELSITSDEEVVLKRWNREHPVDEEEMQRNNEIQKVQFNRNPFIDHPEWADQISDF